jgi:hypothetical protein
VTVALAAAGAFLWLPRHLIRAIIRVGLPDGAGRALPPLAQGRVGGWVVAAAAARRGCCEKGGRFGVWRWRGSSQFTSFQVDILLEFYIPALHPMFTSSVQLGSITELF